jgi:probable addiction module antidote protein
MSATTGLIKAFPYSTEQPWSEGAVMAGVNMHPEQPMNTIFIGGSRYVTRLPVEVKKRLDNVIGSGHRVIVGDANGADKAVQKHLHDAGYGAVTVFCSGDTARNNLGGWQIRAVHVPRNLKGFQFYAAKDREMAAEADFGLMIWDGRSAGTALNVLRLVGAGKIAVLFNVQEKRVVNFKAAADWDAFLGECGPELLTDLKARATPEEWMNARLPEQASFLDKSDTAEATDRLTAEINAALAAGDMASVVDALGNIAKTRGMSQVASETGLARESLYRSLGAEGNPEFATVLKVMAALGLRLEATRVRP